MRFKGSKDQRINRPPKAAVKGSKDQPAAEGGSQRIKRRRRRRAKDQPTAEGGSQRISRRRRRKGSTSRRRRQPKDQISATTMFRFCHALRCHGISSQTQRQLIEVFSGAQRTVCVSRAPGCTGSQFFGNVAQLLKLVRHGG